MVYLASKKSAARGNGEYIENSWADYSTNAQITFCYKSADAIDE